MSCCEKPNFKVLLKIMQNIMFQWFSWYFLEMPMEMLGAWKNFLKFNLEYFSIALLLKTFFQPWRRYEETYNSQGLNIGRFLECFFSNLIFRVLGAIIRSGLILTGLIVQLLIVFIGIIMLIWWFILPILLILGFFYGFKILI